MIFRFSKSLTRFFLGEMREADLSRRELLIGAGAAGLAMFAGSALLMPSTAEAQGHYGGPPRRREPQRRPAPPPSRSRGRRYSRASLQSQCRRDSRFRRNNRDLCRRVMGMRPGRRGSCVSFGPVTICE